LSSQRQETVRRIAAPDIAARKGGVPVVCLTAYTAPMADLARITPVTVPSDYFREAMGRLEARLLGCTLEAPRLSLSPAGSGIGLVLRWTAVDGADEYVVHRDRDAQFDAAREVFRGPGTTATVKGPRIGELWFRVRAESSGGNVRSNPLPGLYFSHLSHLSYHAPSIRRARVRADEYATAARTALDHLPESEFRDCLAAIPTYVVDRDR